MVRHNKDTTRPTIIIDFMSRASEVKRLKKTNDRFFAKNNELVNTIILFLFTMSNKQRINNKTDIL